MPHRRYGRLPRDSRTKTSGAATTPSESLSLQRWQDSRRCSIPSIGYFGGLKQVSLHSLLSLSLAESPGRRPRGNPRWPCTSALGSNRHLTLSALVPVTRVRCSLPAALPLPDVGCRMSESTSRADTSSSSLQFTSVYLLITSFAAQLSTTCHYSVLGLANCEHMILL